MQNSLVKLAQAGLSLTVVLCFRAIANAQTDSCSQRGGGVVGVLPNWQFDINEWCTATPTDIVSFGTNATCRGCLAGNANHAPSFSKGGMAGCTRFDQQMVIDFSQPVADLEWEIYGARTVTDNRGYSVHMVPALYSDGHPSESGVAKFPGSGINLKLLGYDICAIVVGKD